MDIITGLPEIGSSHYDDPVTDVFNAADVAYGIHEHGDLCREAVEPNAQQGRKE